VSEDVDVSNEPRSDPMPRPPRGWVSLYALSFLLLVGAGVAFAASASGLLASSRLQWTSTALSALAIVVAIASVVLPRR
jgi:hypothetical protein